MAKTRYTIVAYKVCVKLTNRQWSVLDTLDYEVVQEALKGATEVEFNNHFGRYIWFEVFNVPEIDKLTQSILKLLNGRKGPLTKQCAI